MPGGREEYRLTLRSLYLLERLLTCCSNWSTMLPDDLLSDTRIAPSKLSDEDVTLWMARLLGANVAYSLQRNATEELAPWRPESIFARLSTDLQRLEPYFEASTCSLLKLNTKQPATQEAISSWIRDEPLFLHVLYHINYCLLFHPFLVQQRGGQEVSIPAPVWSDCVAKGRRHAALLGLILGVIRSHGQGLQHAIFAYAATLAGSILQLHASNIGSEHASAARELRDACLIYLEERPRVHERSFHLVWP